MADAFRKLGMAAALGTLLLAGGISGCSSMSTDHVDCNVVKLQAQSGRSDAEIASAVGASVEGRREVPRPGDIGQRDHRHPRVGPLLRSAADAGRDRNWCERGDLNPYELALTRS